MPARRELHTGRYNFLHRSWGPLEPFDDSMPELLRDNGVWSHLVSDHYHYWEDGGCNYHSRYSGWEIVRGQEGDPCKCDLRELEIPEHVGGQEGDWGRQDWLNRSLLSTEEDHCLAKTFALGEQFIETNAGEDRWFLQIEAFDPHEPFFSAERFQKFYPDEYDGPLFDWPHYRQVTENEVERDHVRYQYASLVSMCDHYLGKVLDLFDQHDLWKDTMLTVCTDHGFLLGEHGWWGKNIQPFYDEVIHTPLFMWDPRSRECNERRASLVQMIDLPPTLLEFFDLAIPEDMMGKPLRETIHSDRSIRDAGLFGIFGGHINCTDGRYVYMRGSATEANTPLYNHTLMPMHMRRRFSTSELETAEFSGPFDFAKNCKTLKVGVGVPDPASARGSAGKESNALLLEYCYSGYREPADLTRSMLFDLDIDPQQKSPLQDPQIEGMMTEHLVRLMQEADAPAEQYQRVGLATSSELRTESADKG